MDEQQANTYNNNERLVSVDKSLFKRRDFLPRPGKDQEAKMLICRTVIRRAFLTAAFIATFAACAISAAFAADVAVHSSGRYFQDSSGKPLFLIGYYGWAAVPDGYYIDHPSRYTNMMQVEAPYKINYIRVSLGVNRFKPGGNPPVYSGSPTPVPFLYVNCSGTMKADLSQWDPVFWDGLKAQCATAKTNGFFVMVSLFDGVELRDQGGADYGYANCFWNPGNQCGTFYPSGSYGDCGGCFYRTQDFINGTGIGLYQKRLIDKACSELANYDNVIFEVGNELLGSDSAWNTAVIQYIKTKTSKPVTQENNGGTYNRATCCLQGWSQHNANTPAELKSNLASIVGLGYPAWEDPDGPDLYRLGPDDHRRAAWYSLAGGAACFGGFTTDFWLGGSGLNTLKATYYKNLETFLSDTAVKFWEMTPQQALVGNNAENSCIANPGKGYIAYVLNDATATLDLSSVSGSAFYKLYDPKAGALGAQQVVAGGAVRTFNRPTGADDWVIYVYTGFPDPVQTLTVRPAGAITIDGNSADWNLSEFVSIARAGQKTTGDTALTGFESTNLYYAAYAGVLPTSPSDHTAKVYSRHDATYQYFLVRCDDLNVGGAASADSNWSNDCVEFYIDPSNDGGASALSGSTSDIQLAIDHLNQKNVYSTTGGYAAQVLSGITSAVTKDAGGWWLEVRLAKNALSPALPSSGVFGLDFNYRDNDNNNDPALTTVYTWADTSTTGFPSKIPDHWATAFLYPIGASPYPGPAAVAIPGTVQAENYDAGGEGLGYHDTTPTNTGGGYRADGVDIEAASDAGGGYSIGYIDTGEWLGYTIDVAAGGQHDIKMRVATPNSGSTFHIEMDGQDITGIQPIASTGGWQSWTTITLSKINISAGRHWMKVVADAGGWNFNYVDIRTVTTCQAGDPMELGQTYALGAGQCPSIATDSQGNIHLIYTTSGTNLYYAKYAPGNLTTPALSETLTPPRGAYWLHIRCDANDVPHIVFSETVGDITMPYTNYTYYTNRIGGSWKTPLQVNYDTGIYNADDINAGAPRLALWGNYAFVGTWYTVKAGKIVRLTNLSTTPAVDTSIRSGTGYVITGERSTIAVNSQGHVFAIGRNLGDAFVEEFDANLNTVVGRMEVMFGYAGKPQLAWTGADDNTHFLGWQSSSSGAFPCNDVCEMAYTNSARRNANGSFPTEIRGLRGGPAGSGPEGLPAEPSGWWNDDVSPVICVDKINRVYVAYRNWSPAGEGKITTVSNSGFVETCTPNATCGGNICAGSQFSSSIDRRRWYNCEIAPASTGGVYAIWASGGTMYIRGIGVGSECNRPPAPPTQFAAAAGSGQVGLSWTNPVDQDFVGTVVRYRTDAYPSSATDGLLVCDRAAAPGSSDLYIHTGLTNGVNYYYSSFAYDRQPLYSDPAVATSRPNPLPEWLNEVLDGYNDGDLGGQGNWSTLIRAGQVESAVAKGGTGKAVLFDSLAQNGSIGNQITVTDKTTGLIDFSFDIRQDAAGTTGQEFGTVNLYGSDSAVPICKLRIQKSRMFLEYLAGSGSLATISTNAVSGTWYSVKLSLNCDTKKIDAYLDGVSKGNNLGWAGGATRLSRILISTDRNTTLTQQQLYVDNVRLEPKPGQVTSVTDDGTWSPSLSKLHFTFPAVAGTPEYQYAVGTTSGGIQTRGWTSCGTSTDVTATGLSLAESATTTYYVSVQCLTMFGSTGATRTSNGIKVAPGLASINAAKALADGTSSSVKSLRGKLVSAAFPGYFYVQEPDGPYGLKIMSTASINVGDQVDVCGAMKGSGSERYMDATGNGVIVTAPGAGAPKAVAIGNSGLGGGPLNALTPGANGGTGPNNIGLLARVWGKVTSAAGSRFVIADGSVASVTVEMPDSTGVPAVGCYVCVTGVSSLDASLERIVRVQQTGDVVLLRTP